MINTTEMRAKYATRGKFVPAGAKDVLALCDEIDRLYRKIGFIDCHNCEHLKKDAFSDPCYSCHWGSKWEAADNAKK